MISFKKNTKKENALLVEDQTLSFKDRFLRVVNILFVLLLLIQLLPNHNSVDPKTAYLIGFAVILETVVIIVSALIKNKAGHTLFVDIVSFVYGLLILWTLATAKFNLLKESLFPPAGRIFYQFVDDGVKLLVHAGSSLAIVLEGYALGLVLAIPLGLFLGWSARLGSSATYISKFFGSIPPIVYIPYGIALLPTFRSVSVFVIFLAAFWPAFAGTMSGVLHVEKKIIDSAKVLNVKKFTMLFKIILPAALPEIFLGCNQGLGVSFILLTSAEMIGASRGIGFYVKQYSDFGDYTRTIVGLIVIGIVVVVITMLFNKLQGYLLRWKK
ncbi:MAG: ABC transporter permease subunit [Treponema sp.]|nr:ABC transporter permease subunit [Treponema sp.]